MKKNYWLAIVLLVASLFFIGTVSAQQAQRNVFGGYNYSNGVVSQPNVFGGYNYSNGLTSQRNVFGGQNYSNGVVSQPNVFGGFNYSNGITSQRNVFGGQNYYQNGRHIGTTSPTAGGGWNVRTW
jgi:hypothetical protein